MQVCWGTLSFGLIARLWLIPARAWLDLVHPQAPRAWGNAWSGARGQPGPNCFYALAIRAKVTLAEAGG